MSNDVPAPRTIYLRAVVDTDALDACGHAMAEDGAPIGIAADSAALVLTSAAPTAITSGSASVAAAIGDTLRFYAITGSNNFEDAVLIAGIRRTGTDHSISGFAPVCLQRSTVVPDAQPDSTSRVGTAEQDFWFWQGTVADYGNQDCSLVLSLYRRDEIGQPRFAGFYRWDLQLTVSDTSNPQEPEEQTS